MTLSRTFLAVVGLLVLALGACSQLPRTTISQPPPATAEEIRVFCERYEEVKNLSYGELYGALIEVAPAEIKDSLIRMVNNPGPTDDDFKVDEFLDHCDTSN